MAMKNTLSTLLAFLLLVWAILLIGGAAIWATGAAFGQYDAAYSSLGDGPQNRGRAHLAVIDANAASSCVPLAYGTSTSPDLDEYTCRTGDKVVRCIAGRVVAEPSCKIILDFGAASAAPSTKDDAKTPEASSEPPTATATPDKSTKKPKK